MASFFTGIVWPLIVLTVEILCLVVPLLVAMAYLTYAERKVIAAMQLRQGPMTVGPFGLLQPLADGLKLFVKETVIPTSANKVVFVMAPMLTFILALIGWAVMPFGDGLVFANINVGVLYLFAISSLGVYGIIMAGWASNSRYAFLGALRSSAQMVSYEIAIGLIILSVLVTAARSISRTSSWPRGAGLVRALALPDVHDLHRLDAGRDQPPSIRPARGRGDAGDRLQCRVQRDDLRALLPRRIPEHDPDERHRRGALPRRLAAILPFWPFILIPGPIWFILKICLMLFVFIWVRATLPRYRYDQLMRLGWKVFLPLSLAWLVLTSGVLVAFDLLPR